MYGSALKGNEYLSQALLTRIQRVARESIFSKLNNLQVYSVIREDYAPFFGITEAETEMLCLGIAHHKKHVKWHGNIYPKGHELRVAL